MILDDTGVDWGLVLKLRGRYKVILFITRQIYFDKEIKPPAP